MELVFPKRFTGFSDLEMVGVLNDQDGALFIPEILWAAGFAGVAPGTGFSGSGSDFGDEVNSFGPAGAEAPEAKPDHRDDEDGGEDFDCRALGFWGNGAQTSSRREPSSGRRLGLVWKPGGSGAFGVDGGGPIDAECPSRGSK